MSKVTQAKVVAAAALALAALAGEAAASSTAISLELSAEVVRYGRPVTFRGAVVPAARARVEIVDATSRVVAAGESRDDGTYAVTAVAGAPGPYVARAADVLSAPASLRIEPVLRARFRGPRFPGRPLELAGRVTPARAGSVTLRASGRSKPIRVDRRGRFRTLVTPRGVGPLRAAVRVRPADGYVAVRVVRATRVWAPTLGQGMTGPAVRFVEQRLRELRYALPRADGRFGVETREAVWAFQKVEGLLVTGIVTPAVWRRLAVARTPRAAVPSGNHVEVDKGRQLLYEVRGGRVTQVVHVSTGATGNTPLGRWRVYWKLPSFNAIGMYYSLFFLRGFAIHGYRSVPPFPASHGCVRLPLWFAPGFYSRWPVGAVIHISP